MLAISLKPHRGATISVCRLNALFCYLTLVPVALAIYFFLFSRVKPVQQEAHESSCKPCPVAASTPVCGSDGHNYASEVKEAIPSL